MRGQERVKVWDAFVRCFHWALAALVIFAFLGEGEPERLHVLAGYGILGLVAGRLVWGVLGSPRARFSDFVRGPRTALRYLADELRGRAPRYLGHNPAAGLMAIALMLMVTATGLAGLALYAADDGAGPLASVVPRSEAMEETLEETHEVLAEATMLLVLLHLAGVALGSIAHRENLVGSMIHGLKRRE